MAGDQSGRNQTDLILYMPILSSDIFHKIK